MIKYIFNTEGEYVAYLYNNFYCFSNNNEYIGFMKGINLYNYEGIYLGTLTSDDRIIKDKNNNYPNISPINKPPKPFPPLLPLKRYKMSNLNSRYIDIFMNNTDTTYYQKFDAKYKKFLNCKLYAKDDEFLGVLNTNKYDRNSLANKYGNYGSEYSSKSVFNKYGPYGSEYSSQSPFNKYSNSPLIIKDGNNNIIGRISNNKYLGYDVINATEFFNWYKEKIM